MAKRHIFVFGSNLAGRHGKGAARAALRQHGAIYGQAKGLQGNSYAIPTKDKWVSHPLRLGEIAEYVVEFVLFARANPGLVFDVTRIGCGLAGYKDEDIAPLFARASDNCRFPQEWKPWLGENRLYRACHWDKDGEETGHDRP